MLHCRRRCEYFDCSSSHPFLPAVPLPTIRLSHIPNRNWHEPALLQIPAARWNPPIASGLWFNRPPSFPSSSGTHYLPEHENPPSPALPLRQVPTTTLQPVLIVGRTPPPHNRHSHLVRFRGLVLTGQKHLQLVVLTGRKPASHTPERHVPNVTFALHSSDSVSTLFCQPSSLRTALFLPLADLQLDRQICLAFNRCLWEGHCIHSD
jgi:hypothetical protein